MRGNGQTAFVNTTNNQFVTFTADAADTVTQARLYAATTVSGSPVLNVGLYAVDSNGAPTGTALTSGSVTATTAGWTSIDLSNYTLTAGTTYALAVSTATASGSFGWSYTAENPANTIQPVGVEDDHWRRGNNGVVATSGQNMWALATSTSGKTIGQPYISSSAQSVTSPTVTRGQRFVFDLAGSGGNDLLESVTLFTGVTTAPSSPVTLKVIDSLGNVLATTSLDLSAASGAALRTFDLSSPISLTDGEAYYLGLYSNTGAVTWYGWNVTDEAFYIDASYQGGDSYAVSWASQTDFTGAPSELKTRDHYFGLNMVPEPSVAGLVCVGLAFALLRRRTVRA